MSRNAGRAAIEAAPPVESSEMSFITPSDFVDLPSRGLFYRTGHPLHGEDAVEIKHMTAKEEDILTSESLIKKGIVFDKLLGSITLTKGVNPSSLLSGDRSAMILQARKAGYGEIYKTNAVCPVCGAHNSQEHDLNDAKINDWQEYCAENDISIEDGLFKFSLPVTKYMVSVRPLLGADELEFNKKKEPSLVDQMAQYVVEINGETEPTTLRRAVESLPAFDAKFIRRNVKSMMPNISMMHEFECKTCGFDTEMEVKINPDFFWFD